MPQSKKAVKKATPKKSATVKNTKTAASPERKKLGLTPYVLFAAAIFICITFFIDDSGFLGKYIKLVLWGLFGTGSFFIPFYMIFTAIFWKRDHENKIAGTKYLLATLNFVFILIIIHLFSPAPQANEGVSFAENLYENGKKLIDGGVIGGSIGYGIQKLIGYVASLVLSFFLSAVTLIFFFGSTPMRVIKYIIDLFKKVELQDLQNDEKDVPEPKIQKAQKPEKSTARDAAKSCAEPRTLPDETFFSTEKDGQQKFNAPFVPQADIPGIKVDHKTGFSNEELNRDYKRIFEEDSAKKDPLKKDPLKKEPENKIIHEKDLSPKIEQVKNAFDQATPIDFSQTEILDQNPEILLTHNPIDVPENLHDDAESVNDSADLQFESETAELEFGGEPPYIFPPISLLTQGKSYYDDDNYENILETGKKLVEILESYGVKTKLISTSRGPTVTRYELQPDAGVRVAKIANLSDDIRMRLAATNIRIETNIPGKSAVGIEVPNVKSEIVNLRNLIENPIFSENKSKLFVSLGVDVGGNPVYFDIPDMPHLLIAGATGMGKSVCINSIIISLLYRAKPDEVKLILIDPKKVELACYNDIPHLHIPVVNEPRKAAGALNWAVVEMEKRYTSMTEVGDARNLKEYNEMIEGDPEREKIPYLVIIIDELADLIMSAPDDVETSICRLAQKARAAGIYLIIGTQRPSVDVITGLIKANIPSRIAFTVSSQVDSRTILDMSGAEKLLGRGDMLFAAVKELKPKRVQGAYVDGKTEVSAVCNFVKNAAKVTYNDDVIKMIEEEAKLCGLKPSQRAKEENSSSADEKEDSLFLDAIAVAFEYETMSTSLLQRKLSIGYSRAQKIIDMMESRGYVGKFDPATKKRKINITFEEYQQLRINNSEESK